MKVLIVCSGNAENFDFKIHHAFVYEQIESLKRSYEIEYETFFIRGKWFTGYLKNLFALRKKINSYSPDIVHGHFGLSGLLACLQRKKPVIVTFHGSDANVFKVRLLSKMAAKLSRHSIFVSQKVKDKIKGDRFSVIPCGIDLHQFYPLDMITARKQLKMESDKIYILFSSGFENSIKNSKLAITAVEKLNKNYQLLELKNRCREEVNLLLNACNLLLLTSISEGSPQIIKEAMACNCPIVATDVGDIKTVITDTQGCYLTSFDPGDVAEKIEKALIFNKRTNGREKISHFDNKLIAQNVYNIYKTMIR